MERQAALQQADIQRLQDLAKGYRAKIDASPAVESELTQLTRDYDVLKTTYTELLKKKQEASLAANVEQRQVGEQFTIVDPARLPQKPDGPNRVRYDLLGSAAGLGLGLAFALLLEYRDTSLRSEEDVLVTLALPVVALIPTIHTFADRRRLRRRRWVLASSAAATLLVAAVAIAWKLRAG
jgi:uncharacterized protein involved in exopolysaccharide biosynthesis